MIVVVAVFVIRGDTVITERLESRASNWPVRAGRLARFDKKASCTSNSANTSTTGNRASRHSSSTNTTAAIETHFTMGDARLFKGDAALSMLQPIEFANRVQECSMEEIWPQIHYVHAQCKEIAEEVAARPTIEATAMRKQAEWLAWKHILDRLVKTYDEKKAVSIVGLLDDSELSIDHRSGVQSRTTTTACCCSSSSRPGCAGTSSAGGGCQDQRRSSSTSKVRTTASKGAIVLWRDPV